ncbi:unnamed protein product [Lactuca saligna]|uniref:Uncharacterized protein n=1 Tax=Lactuca saligna TaxID=75948 RepID=A0AA36A118_LACSI|nr:unnamed protein product [Lactuca saligna]
MDLVFLTTMRTRPERIGDPQLRGLRNCNLLRFNKVSTSSLPRPITQVGVRLHPLKYFECIRSSTNNGGKVYEVRTKKQLSLRSLSYQPKVLQPHKVHILTREELSCRATTREVSYLLVHVHLKIPYHHAVSAKVSPNHMSLGHVFYVY